MGQLMTGYQPEFWFRGDSRLILDVAAQHELSDTYERAAKALHTFDRAKEPYSASIELLEHRSNRGASLAEFCKQMIEMLIAPRKSTGGRPCTLRWLTQLHATMRFVDDDMGSRLTLRPSPDLDVQPAGTLLFDMRQPVSPGGGSEPVDWRSAVQTTLPQHPLARAGAEYAVVINFPLPAGVPDRDQEFESGLALIQQIEQFLPATEDQTSMIAEFWLIYPTGDDDPEPAARLRIWRLGVMQIAPTTRHA